MPKLPGHLHQELHNALLSAFPRYSQLKQMVRHQLDENLEKIAGGGNLNELVFNLIEWAEANGRLEDLIVGAREANQGNLELMKFVRHYVAHQGGKPSNTSFEKGSPKKDVLALQNSEIRKLSVFLCHVIEDKLAVRSLYSRLKMDGVDAWLDEEDIHPGENWENKIQNRIRNSDVVIVFISNNSLNKEGYFQKEIRLALDVASEKPEDTIYLIPVRLEECNVPDRLAKFQWMDLFFWELFDERGYYKLLQSLKQRANSIGAPLHLEKLEKLDQDFANLNDDQRSAIDLCSLVRIIDTLMLQQLFGECGSDVHKSWRLEDLEDLLSQWKKMEYLEWKNGFMIKSELRSRLGISFNKETVIKIHKAALGFYQMQWEKPIYDRHRLLIEEIYHSAHLLQLGDENINLSSLLVERLNSIQDYLAKELNQHPSLTKDFTEGWRNSLVYINDAIEQDTDIRNLIGDLVLGELSYIIQENFRQIREDD